MYGKVSSDGASVKEILGDCLDYLSRLEDYEKLTRADVQYFEKQFERVNALTKPVIKSHDNSKSTPEDRRAAINHVADVLEMAIQTDPKKYEYEEEETVYIGMNNLASDIADYQCVMEESLGNELD